MEFLLTKIPRVYKVCKCCDLRTGNKILASFLASIKLLVLILLWHRLYTLDKEVDTLLTAFEGKEATKDEQRFDYFISREAIIALVVILVPTLICLLFVKGINDSNTSYMLPYIYMYSIPAVQIILLAFFSIFLIFFHISFFLQIMLFVIIAFLVGALVAYVPICAFSLYREIEEGKMQNLDGVASGGYVS